EAEYWVKVPSVSGTVDTEIYIYYTTTVTADGAEPESVWDENYMGVWHLKEDPSGAAPQIKDSTSNGIDLTAYGTPTQGDAKVGEGTNFDNDESLRYSSGIYPTTAMTFESWVYWDARLSNVDSVLGEVAGTDYSLTVSNEDLTNTWRGWIYNTSDALGAVNGGTNSAVLDTWAYMVLKYDGSYVRLYKDGEEIGTAAALTGNIKAQGGEFQIASYVSNYRDWDGMIDEARFSFAARSASWIKASYNSGNGTLLACGDEEVLP
ncbi:MAG: LamG domain-containing protein, partial [Candidatus Paceibacterota bacterium]